MRDGLDFVEDYVDDRISDALQMLFGEGQADMAHFAADRPLVAAPGTRFNYSSGTSNIISGIVARTLGPGEPYARFLHDRLFGPIGMTQRRPGVRRGRHLGGVVLRAATARDFARFGLLYLRGGLWDGVRFLPDGLGRLRPHDGSIDDPDGPQPSRRALVGHARATRSTTSNPLGTFRASGYEGQSITICPALDLVLVRLGKTPLSSEPELWCPGGAAVVQAFAAAR